VNYKDGRATDSRGYQMLVKITVKGGRRESLQELDGRHTSQTASMLTV